LATTDDNFTAAENPPEKNSAGHNPAVKNNSAVKFGVQKHMCTAGDKMVSGRKKIVNRNHSLGLKMHLQFYIYAACMAFTARCM